MAARKAPAKKTAAPAKKAPAALQEAPAKGTPWLVEQINERIDGADVSPFEVRTILRKLAKDGEVERPEEGTRYSFTGLKDPAVVAVFKAIKDKLAKVDTEPAPKPAKKAPAKKAPARKPRAKKAPESEPEVVDDADTDTDIDDLDIDDI